MKTLIFDGAGWAEADTSKGTDVTNCRIRTRLRNNIGRVIYLEMGCCHYDSKTKYIPKYAEGLNYATHIDHLFYTDSKWDSKRNCSRELSPLTTVKFEYNKENVLNFVNNSLNCSFDSIEVVNDGLNIHATKEPICDCSDGNYEPYKDIEINIATLDGIKPVIDNDKLNFADYRLSYNSAMKLDYMRKYVQDRTETEQRSYKSLNFVSQLRWDSKGVITELVITGKNFCHLGLGSENLQEVIDMIKDDNRKEITA